jgi:hypothetical protein
MGTEMVGKCAPSRYRRQSMSAASNGKSLRSSSGRPWNSDTVRSSV